MTTPDDGIRKTDSPGQDATTGSRQWPCVDMADQLAEVLGLVEEFLVGNRLSKDQLASRRERIEQAAALRRADDARTHLVRPPARRTNPLSPTSRTEQASSPVIREVPATTTSRRAAKRAQVDARRAALKILASAKLRAGQIIAEADRMALSQLEEAKRDATLIATAATRTAAAVTASAAVSRAEAELTSVVGSPRHGTLIGEEGGLGSCVGARLTTGSDTTYGARGATDSTPSADSATGAVQHPIAAKIEPHAVPAPAASEPLVSVIIPALDEAPNLPHVFARLPEVDEVILVDGGSTDDTVDVARRLMPGIRIVRQNRKGKGNALACGFAAATGDILVMLDADGSTDPVEIPSFIAALRAGADFAKGSRFRDAGGSADITWLSRLGNKCLSRVVNAMFGTRYSDLCYGYNAFWAYHLDIFGLDSTSPAPPGGEGRWWGDGAEIEALLNLRAARARLRVVEVPSFERSRIHGENSPKAVFRGLRILRTVAREWPRRSRNRSHHTPGTEQTSPSRENASEEFPASVTPVRGRAR